MLHRLPRVGSLIPLRHVVALVGLAALGALSYSCGDSTTPPAAPSAETSRLTLSAASVVSGSSITATLQLNDASGNALHTAGVPVTFTLGAGSATGTFGAVTDHGDGSYSTTFTGVLIGTPRVIGASIAGVPVTTPLPSVTVTPGPPAASQSVITASATTITSGNSATLTVQAKDAAGNALTAGGATVVFSLGASGNSAGTFSTSTDNGNGTYTSTFVATTAGTARVIAATIDGAAITSTPPSITVTPGVFSAAQSLLTSSSSTLASGSTALLKLRLRDAAGNFLMSGGATVVFTLGAGTSGGAIGTTTDSSSGTYTAPFTATTVGSARAIGATVNGVAVTSTLPTITTIPGAASTAQSIVEVSSATVEEGSTALLVLRAKDAAGNALAAGGLTVTFQLGGGTSDGTVGAVTDNANGTYSATFSALTAGTARAVGATINGDAVTSPSPSITVVAPGSSGGGVSPSQSTVTVSSSSIASGTTTTVTFQAKDASGTNIAAGGASVSFALGVTGTSTGTFGPVIDHGDGTYAATLTGVLAGTARAIATTVNGQGVTSSPAFTVTPGSPSEATSEITVGAATVASGSSTTITLHAKDAAGNTISVGGASVTFALGSGTSSGTLGSVTDNGNGTYAATFDGITAGSARAITATVNGAPVSTTAPTIVVVPGAISVSQSTVSVSAPRVPTSAAVTFTLAGKDAHGNALTSGGSTVAFSVGGGGTSAGTIGGTIDHGDGTYTATFTGTTAGSPVNVNATIDGDPVTTSPPTVYVYAPGMSLSSTSVMINGSEGAAAPVQYVGVFADGGASVAGLSYTIDYSPSASTGTCASANWLQTPTFDFTTANPVAVLTLNATATGLGVYTCTATVTVHSTTSGVADKQFTVNYAVARGSVISTAVNMVSMGNAGNAAVQDLTPDARVLITNGGRGIVTGLHASVSNVNGVGDNGDPWITDADLSWDPVVPDTGARPAPSTLVIHFRVKPFNADADVTVTGNGISPIVIPVTVLFNTQPQLVTNPRGLTFTGFAGGSSLSTSVLAFNQNREIKDSLMNYGINSSAFPSWLSATATGLPSAAFNGRDTAATVQVSVDPSALLADSTYTDTVRVTAEECLVAFGESTCAANGTFRQFALPVTVVVERGLVVGVDNATIFVPAGTSTSFIDIPITNGGSTP
ncbi:MAG TPA: Ig-like domain-containing protein, partial [Gemmatimonadaceae bacterium]|nr:Ig-like domain-containing protein [Gemmatimonadaceae bacterium]